MTDPMTPAHPDAWMLTDDGRGLVGTFNSAAPDHSSIAYLRDRIVAACEARMAVTVREKERTAFKKGWDANEESDEFAQMAEEREHCYPLSHTAYPSRTSENGRVFRQVGPNAFEWKNGGPRPRAYWSRRDIPWSRDEIAAIDAVLAEEVK